MFSFLVFIRFVRRVFIDFFSLVVPRSVRSSFPRRAAVSRTTTRRRGCPESVGGGHFRNRSPCVHIILLNFARDAPDILDRNLVKYKTLANSTHARSEYTRKRRFLITAESAAAFRVRARDDGHFCPHATSTDPLLFTDAVAGMIVTVYSMRCPIKWIGTM